MANGASDGDVGEAVELPKTWRELRSDLAKLGAAPVRCKGSHETWRFEDGEVFVAVVNHLGDDVSKGMLSKYRRLKVRRSRMPQQPQPGRAAARRRGH